MEEAIGSNPILGTIFNNEVLLWIIINDEIVPDTKDILADTYQYECDQDTYIFYQIIDNANRFQYEVDRMSVKSIELIKP